MECNFLVTDSAGTHWYRNNRQTPVGFAPTALDFFVRPGEAVDVDGDGDLDFLNAQTELFLIVENTGGPTPEFGERILRFCEDGDVYDIVAADIDLDGRADILTSDSCDLGIAWHQNVSGDSSSGSFCWPRDLLLDEAVLPRVARVDGVTTNEGLGHTVSVVGDVNGDGIDDLLLGTGNTRFCVTPWSGLGVFAGKAYVVFGGPTLKTGGFPNIGEMSTEQGCVINPRAAFHPAMNLQVARAGDINGDGTTDLLISEYESDIGDLSSAGKVYVVFGGPDVCNGAIDGELDLLNLDGFNGFTIDGLHEDQDLGRSMTGLGDVNHDGIDDFLIISTRRAYLVFGRHDWPGQYALNNIAWGLGGETEGVYFLDEIFATTRIQGHRAGDFNGDGLDDLVFGAVRGSLNPVGRVMIIYGRTEPWPAVISIAPVSFDEGTILTSDYPSGSFGFDVDGIGDLNGDSFGDIIVGEPLVPSVFGPVTPTGRAHVFFGHANPPTQLETSALDGANGFSISGVEPRLGVGSIVSAVGDHNGDGVSDFVIGQAAASVLLLPQSLFTGHDSFVVFGGPGVGEKGTIHINMLNGLNGYVAHGLDDDEAGRVVAHGDVDGDEIEDVIIGAPGANAPSCMVPSGGRVYVVFGCDESATIAGDWDGDGDVDLPDFGWFQVCFTGSCADPPCNPVLYDDANCRIMDFDLDGDVDLLDFGQFQIAYTGEVP